MSTAFSAISLVLSILLIVAILLQVKGTGAGFFGGSYGGGYRTRRGFERTLFRGTVVLVAVFVLNAILAARFH